ncbi:MAG: GntR family transcriptional regulator [Anaerolineales bacterium]|jgi:DNA-binding GntR family transcriptional regulator
MVNHEDVKESLDAFQHRPLKEAIFEFLHDRIIAGRFEPGEWLRQEEIASRLGVSQTPVREALDLLVSSGLAERVAYRGVRVLQLSVEEMVDAYALRLLLEGSAARAAALNRTSVQVKELDHLVEAMKPLTTLKDMSAQRQLNREFHLLVASASGNLQLTRLCEMAANKFPDWMLYEYMFRHPELLQTSLEKEYTEHQAIAAAIAAADPDLAVLCVTRHIQNRRDELVAYLGIPPDLLDKKARQLNPLLPGL